MATDGVKIYGLCLERLRHQIARTKERAATVSLLPRVILESYTTDNLEELIDILELYDLNDHSLAAVQEKLDELACTVSVLTRERLHFDTDGDGLWGLYVTLKNNESSAPANEPVLNAAAR